MKNKRRDPSIDSYIPSSRMLQIEEFSLTSIHRSTVSFFLSYSVRRRLFLDCRISDKVRGAILSRAMVLHRSYLRKKFYKSGYILTNPIIRFSTSRH